MTHVWAVLRKDLRVEWRTKESLASLGVLAVLLVVVLVVAHDPTPAEAARIAPPVLWATFVFTGVLGLQRVMLLEREQDCLATLLLAPMDASAIWGGKLLANLLLLAVVQGVVSLLVGLMLRVDLLAAGPGLVVVQALGAVGFAALATLFGTMAVRIRAREVMLPLLVLPLAVPLVIAGVKATTIIVAGGGLVAAQEPLGILVAFDVIVVVAGWMLFEYVVRDA